MTEAWQSVQISDLKHAQRLASRLLRQRHGFQSTVVPGTSAYILSFSNKIDFDLNRKLFALIDYRLVPNPV